MSDYLKLKHQIDELINILDSRIFPFVTKRANIGNQKYIFLSS